MANADVVAYNIAAFIATLFLLEFGADKFIDHTALVARRTGIPETLIGLLTAGGEWEEVCSQLCIAAVVSTLTTSDVIARRCYCIPRTESCIFGRR
jgi:Ca2+/Na+ antiporter